MALYNSVRLTGYINTGRDENGNPNPLNLRTVGQGEKSFYSMNFTLSVPRDRKDRDGKRKYDYLNISITGPTAKFVAEYFKPGDLIVVEGYVSTRYYDKDGNRHYITEITVDGKVGFPLLKANGEENQQQMSKVTNKKSVDVDASEGKPETAYKNGPADFSEEEFEDDDLLF